jgi:hypothetical protein
MRIEDVFGVLHDAISTTYSERLRDFVNRNAVPNWVIASDYVIGDKDRHRNAFCYTIYPLNDELESTLTEIRKRIPQDLKDTPRISGTIAECLQSTRRFSFCFVARQGQRFFGDAADIRASLDATIEIVGARANWDKQTATLKRLRQEAAAKDFNYRLGSDIVLASLFASVIAMFITKFGNAKSVFWFSDRDSIVTSYRQVAFDLFGMHFYQACYEYGADYDPVNLGVGDMRDKPWFDELIRVPDFLAGAMSAFNPDTREVSTQKHLDLLTKVISDAPHIAIIGVEVGRGSFGCQPFLMSQASATPEDEGRSEDRADLRRGR